LELDIVIADFAMPEMNFELSRPPVAPRGRSASAMIQPTFPAILMTGYGDHDVLN
jgi:hypothetical protein